FNEASEGAAAYRLNSASYRHPTDGAWVHVAATYDGSTARLYIDGTENNSITFPSAPPIGTNALPLTMGALTDGTRGFEGSMDDVRIYNVALGAAEVQNLATLNANIRMASSEIEETIQKEEEVMEVEMNEFDVKLEELNNEFSDHPNPFSTSTSASF